MWHIRRGLLILQQAEDLPEKTWRKFEAFVLRLPHIYTFTHTLRIVHMSIQHGRTKEHSKLLQNGLVLDFRALASSLVRLKMLVLSCVDLFLPFRYTVRDIQRLQCTMEAFILLIDERMPNFTVNDIVAFLLPFTNLRSLTPEYVDFVTAKIPALQFFPRFPRLRSLKSRSNEHILLFLDVLHDAIGKDLLPCLEHLEVGEVNPRELGRVPRLLNRMSGWLHHFTFQFDYYRRLATLVRAFLVRLVSKPSLILLRSRPRPLRAHTPQALHSRLREHEVGLVFSAVEPRPAHCHRTPQPTDPAA